MLLTTISLLDKKFFFLLIRQLSISTLFPYTTLFRSLVTALRMPVTSAPNPGSGMPPMLSVRSPSRLDVSEVRRSEEHTSELQSQFHLVCRLLLEKKKISR